MNVKSHKGVYSEEIPGFLKENHRKLQTQVFQKRASINKSTLRFITLSRYNFDPSGWCLFHMRIWLNLIEFM